MTVAVAIFNGLLNVNTLRNVAGLNQGMNSNVGWTYYSKTNDILSQTAGNLNFIPVIKNILLDPDVVDSTNTNAGGNSPTAGTITEVI
ncbi:hypothetical protein DCCM_0233 [Desulfocucumis palustris]|uniref:Uncharacterized protein n=2 Tax=Desulfocucumis palustris TaxID=1898651 RepID=A0A2L2X7T2_9FIRM|nr:hypothetical protein DCCM_0233 [Desulfocucumis palustris]